VLAGVTICIASVASMQRRSHRARSHAQIEVHRASVVVTFTVAPNGDCMHTCPSNRPVAYVVRLGDPIRDRRLIDGACSRLPAKTTAPCEFGAVRWSP